jgi:hypothetical protein
LAVGSHEPLEISMLRILTLLVSILANATWADAETIAVKYYGSLDLKPFACTDVTRSSFINRAACYDKAKQFMVVQLKGPTTPTAKCRRRHTTPSSMRRRWASITTPTSRAQARTAPSTAGLT